MTNELTPIARPKSQSWFYMLANTEKKKKKVNILDFLAGPVVENLSATAGDTSLIPGPGGSQLLQGN